MMRRILQVFVVCFALVMTGCALHVEEPGEDTPEAMTRLANETVQLCKGSNSAAASIDGLSVTFEQDFSQEQDAIQRTNIMAEECLLAIAEAKISPGELAIQIVNSAEFNPADKEEASPTVLRAVYNEDTLYTSAEKLESDTEQNIWALADEKEVESAIGRLLVDSSD